MGNYIRKTARYNGKKYEAIGKTEREAMMRLAEKLAAAKRGEELFSGNMTVNAWYKQWKATYKDPKDMTAKSLGMYDAVPVPLEIGTDITFFLCSQSALCVDAFGSKGT